MSYQRSRITIRCPNCHGWVNTIQTDVTYGGSPFHKCKSCGETVFIKQYKEEAFEIYDDDNLKMTLAEGFWAIVFNVLAVFLMAILCVVRGLEIYHYIFIAVMVLLFGGMAIFYDRRAIKKIKKAINPEKYQQKKLDYLEGRLKKRSSAIEESMIRLEDRHYLDELKAHGVRVPQYFYDRLDAIKEASEERIKAIEIDTDEEMTEHQTMPKVSNKKRNAVNEAEKTGDCIDIKPDRQHWKTISIFLACVLALVLAAAAFFVPYINNYSTLLKFSDVSIGASKNADYWAVPDLIYLSDEKAEKVIDVYVGDDEIKPMASCDNGKVIISTGKVAEDGYMEVKLKKRSKGVGMVKFSDENNPNTVFYVIAICK